VRCNSEATEMTLQVFKVSELTFSTQILKTNTKILKKNTALSITFLLNFFMGPQ